jgi:nucleotide-binding universal stress UspA family protein
VLAQRERSRLRGLHVVPRPADISRPEVQGVRERFDRRCQEAGVNGQLLVEAGPVSQVICNRARWNDVVVLNMEYPPGETVLARLGSGLRQILHRCPRPVLAVPHRVSPLTKPLLAYDGSSKSDEALYIAAYLSTRWNQELVVVVVDENGRVAQEAAQRAERYLQEQGVRFQMLRPAGEVVPLILDTAAGLGCDVLVMGGYDSRPAVFEAVLGSTTNAVLRYTTIPVLVCQ